MRHEELRPAAAAERRMLGDVADPLHVGGGQHRQHAGHRLGRRGVDRFDVGEGVRGAHEIGLRLAGQRGVGGEASKPAHQRIILQTRLVVRAVFNSLRIHDDFRIWEGFCGRHVYIAAKVDQRRSSFLPLESGENMQEPTESAMGTRGVGLSKWTKRRTRVPAAAIIGLITDALVTVGLPAAMPPRWPS